ncbi:DNA-binding response regulator [Dictyobacter vulcani]|uniref:DNA-binding response regulator n=1 Tax=Dictyobacter vulcani TaxID=2607529 RepID=A0A5J4KEZ1_9CHLR|nr:response regulator transcription factor [Dictyobacter vulcani]GER87924.1 DNA-binding response regulator [Dictyobacter vulcani]
MRYPDTEDHRLHTTVATESVTLPSPVFIGNDGQSLATGVGDGWNSIGVPPTSQVRVLIVDDHALIREGLSQLFSLEDDIEVVGEAIDGFTAMEQIRQLHPDVVLMDINLPVVDGIAITRQVTQQFPAVAVIMLTMHRQNQQIVEAMRNGARGYLLKNASARDVAQAIRTVHAGGVAISPSLTGVLVNELRRQPDSSAPVGQHMAQLSEKEVEIIRYLAAGMSNKEIAERLAYSEKTVKNYLSIIFQKLHLRDRTQVAIFALRQGLLPDEDM